MSGGLRALELGRIVEQNVPDEYDFQSEMQTIPKEVGGWFEAFVGSPQYQALTEIQKGRAPGIVGAFAEFSFRHLGAAPAQWTVGVLGECCLEIMPRKMSADLPFFQAVAPVLSAFFDFLAGEGRLGKASELSKAATALDEDIVAASQDKRNWGPAKGFIMAAEKAGVDACDQEALTQFMIQYNVRQVAQLEARQGASAPPPTVKPAASVPHSRFKAGRNDPCPCGSGRKFKKCCGA